MCWGFLLIKWCWKLKRRINVWFAESLYLITLALVHYNDYFKWFTGFRNVNVHSLTQALQHSPLFLVYNKLHGSVVGIFICFNFTAMKYLKSWDFCSWNSPYAYRDWCLMKQYLAWYYPCKRLEWMFCWLWHPDTALEM